MIMREDVIFNGAINDIHNQIAVLFKNKRDKYGDSWRDLDLNTLGNFATAKIQRFLATKNVEDLGDAFVFMVFMFIKVKE